MKTAETYHVPVLLKESVDGLDIQYAAQQKKIAKLKELVPGQQDWWYKVHLNDDEYKGRL